MTYLNEFDTLVERKEQNLGFLGGKFFLSKKYALKHPKMYKSLEGLIFKDTLLNMIRDFNYTRVIPCAVRQYDVIVDDVTLIRSEYFVSQEGDRIKFRIVDTNSDDEVVSTSIIFRNALLVNPSQLNSCLLNFLTKNI